MWKIYSKTWGTLECSIVHSSGAFEGQVTAYEVKRNGEPLWEKAYFPMHDLTVIVPPDEMV